MVGDKNLRELVLQELARIMRGEPRQLPPELLEELCEFLWPTTEEEAP